MWLIVEDNIEPKNLSLAQSYFASYNQNLKMRQENEFNKNKNDY